MLARKRTAKLQKVSFVRQVLNNAVHFTFPDISKDLQFILDVNIDDIITKYASYVDCLCEKIEEKRISPEKLCRYLLSLSAFSENYDGQQLALMTDNKEELEKCRTINCIFNCLTMKCASFLNCDIFQKIQENYEVGEEQEKLKYRDHLKAYVEKHKISEFMKINPLLKPKNGSKELTLKYNVKNTCRLARIVDLKFFIAKILKIHPSTLQIIDIEDGCVIVTFLVPGFVADTIFTPDTVFTQQQEDEFQAASILWLRCNNCSFNFEKMKCNVNEGMYKTQL